MSIATLCELFTELLGVRVYALNFPEFIDGTFLKMEFSSSVIESGGVQDFNVQVMAKSNVHPSEAERLCIEVANTLGRITDIEFNKNKCQLILCRSITPQPNFVGETKVGEYIFSTDFRLLTTDI